MAAAPKNYFNELNNNNEEEEEDFTLFELFLVVIIIGGFAILAIGQTEVGAYQTDSNVIYVNAVKNAIQQKVAQERDTKLTHEVETKGFKDFLTRDEGIATFIKISYVDISKERAKELEKDILDAAESKNVGKAANLLPRADKTADDNWSNWHDTHGEAGENPTYGEIKEALKNFARTDKEEIGRWLGRH